MYDTNVGGLQIVIQSRGSSTQNKIKWIFFINKSTMMSIYQWSRNQIEIKKRKIKFKKKENLIWIWKFQKVVAKSLLELVFKILYIYKYKLKQSITQCSIKKGKKIKWISYARSTLLVDSYISGIYCSPLNIFFRLSYTRRGVHIFFHYTYITWTVYTYNIHLPRILVSKLQLFITDTLYTLLH